MSTVRKEKQQQRETKSPFRTDCLSGKVALVTGGGSGICYGITHDLLSHGCTGAVICGRRQDFLERAVASLERDTGKRVRFQVCDVRDPDACAQAVRYTLAQFGKLDILINGAAGNFLAEASALKPKGFKTVMEIDTMGTFNMSHLAYPALKNSGRGCIINISATLQYGATWYQSHASAAKSANDSLTRSLALEWGVDNIRVNGIAPGPIADTPGTTKLAPGLTSEDVNEAISEGIPIGRMGTTTDIGMAAIYLASDGSGSYVTGDILVVDGGEWLYRPPMIPRDMVAALSKKVEKKSRDQAPKVLSKL
uniref:2,4-dienoyl-CoA reductase [(3E)-enoyl-CoA-producing] n=1 Tax=Eucampia antarctica TaxID=49252 RepID=A0A7S2S4X8_9STRA|mmetsp:Transcript_31163/g.30008  ORF Transcript_31163/g.30008 Transcript_31163/m.30008 type:complete len:309 (+) Transcript_31163:41-967(+)|eukprot:CAMPEP_0197831390 /NCGR_PEP_ID=MMETSP1437-20131217/9739_1 /TAXON_ID=49252 ORGANISM="Eucampia antarctica, Strain CCMP1452" /NCGR_SAMPLE_ID=MMETSP1437 /ASSEMBLY_ACC=CAM_ASM_001096 /LENGTH=308 /DNA_ID=CAMNT_0043434289 /DNA_START=31 /DNA_END=957 /DNA_ORIENTATION=-